MKLEVLPTEDGRWGLYVNGVLLGSSKLQCDALLARETLRKAISDTTLLPAHTCVDDFVPGHCPACNRLAKEPL